MAVGSAVSALNRPGWIRKAQQVFTARFALAARRPVRRLPPSPGWTWRCALRKANGRKSLREYPRRSGVYAAPNGSATALPKFVLKTRLSVRRATPMGASFPHRTGSHAICFYTLNKAHPRALGFMATLRAWAPHTHPTAP